MANVTRVYREALDRVMLDVETHSTAESQAHYNLEMAFSRGLHTGWFEGINNQELVHARFGKSAASIWGM